MIIKRSEYIKSAVYSEDFPQHDLPEIVLSGRSNVGKSSFINAVFNRKGIAKVSGNPGKTRTLNFFLLNDDLCFVDVPGYGYAKVSRKQKEMFGEMIESYLTTRDNLRFAILLLDHRHVPTQDDRLMYQFFKHYQIPVIVVLTKLDKLKKNDRVKSKKKIIETLSIDTENDIVIPFSNESKENLEQVYRTIDAFLKKYAKKKK